MVTSDRTAVESVSDIGWYKLLLILTSSIVEFNSEIDELRRKAIGFVAFLISILSILKLDLKRALIRYLSLALVSKSQDMLIIFKPDMLKVVEVNSSRF